MKCKEAFTYIQDLNEKYIKAWVDVCNIESPTTYKAGIDAVGKYFADMAEEFGWDIEYCRQQTAIAITMNSHVKARPLALSGHIDTVHPLGLFGTPAVRVEVDKIYGPGVIDCTGGVVAAMLAMEALFKAGYTDRPIVLIIQTDEEMGSSPSNKETVKFMCEKGKDAVAFLNLEGYTLGEACIQRKGITTYNFSVTGVEAHSSMCAERGANAILEAAHKIIELETVKDPLGLTCCCSVISGGSVPNTVPGRCEFRANVRFANSEQLAWMDEFVRTVAERVTVSGCSTEVSRGGYRPAMAYSERNEKLLSELNDCFEACGLPRLAGGKRTGGSDAAYVTDAGIPCLDSLGVNGGRIHSADEYAVISSLAEAARRIAAAAYYLKD